MSDKLKRLNEAATPGPWCAEIPDMIRYNNGDGNIGEIWSSPNNPETHIQCDAELIVYLRNHAADFIALIEAAKEMRECSDWEAKKMLNDAIKPFEGE